MIVYCIPEADPSSPTGDVYVGTQREAFDIARDGSRADTWGDEFPPDAIRGRGREIRVKRLRLRRADKAGILAMLNHERFVVESKTVAVFRNGRRVKGAA